MYCRNCGNEVSEKAIMCVACGTPPKAENKYCYNCKSDTAPNANICMKCGVPINEDVKIDTANKDMNQSESKDWLATLLLCIFTGGLGIHRFYTGHIVIGLVQFFTLGGCGIWTFIDLILIAIGNFKDASGNKLVKK